MLRERELAERPRARGRRGHQRRYPAWECNSRKRTDLMPDSRSLTQSHPSPGILSENISDASVCIERRFPVRTPTRLSTLTSHARTAIPKICTPLSARWLSRIHGGIKRCTQFRYSYESFPAHPAVSVQQRVDNEKSQQRNI
ncbi:hypothetical protein KGM_213603 [Danaus plexippus plexippus]|uniref:Uncharacterized protein n=1 Tax=Danaus plexippus plexippus TaxID=278856 RepID=A0A212ENV7_DANPL|nr:hypothetical protein KGM_213603 [Danaus plexippus plexippus]